MSFFNNRRKLVEDQDSYKKTGIPCGNPQRYGSKEVVRMDPVTCLGKRKLTGGDLDMETEGEKQLQVMAKKQLNTKITLTEQIAQHRSFTSSGEYKPSIKTLCGVSHLENYQDVLKQDNAVDELKKCGLTEDEIKLKLGTQESGNRYSYGLHPNAHSGKLEEINQRILERNKSLDTSSASNNTGIMEMGRHELEIEHRLTGEKSQARALSNFLTKKKVITGDPNDPINKLPELLVDIETKGRDRKGKPHRHRNIVRGRASVLRDGECSDDVQDSDFIGPLLPHEMDLSPEVPEPIPARVPLVDADGRRVVVDAVEEVPEDVIRKYRLKVEDIRALPRFENYSPGEPSNVLYLKNLSNKVTEEDLVSLFGRFQSTDSAQIIYRLMTGRMRGQAFVTFNDTEMATSALELCNGYQFRGKPIVIQYGRKSTGNVT